jgi:hypothetical protein
MWFPKFPSTGWEGINCGFFKQVNPRAGCGKLFGVAKVVI